VGKDDREETSPEDENDPFPGKGKLEIDPTEDSPDAGVELGTIEQGGVAPDQEQNVGGKTSSNPPKRKAGKQPGAPGYGRTQVIPESKLEVHRATRCAACGADLPDDAPFEAKTGFRVIDIKENDDGQWGIVLECTLHHFGETLCSCGHRTLVMPGRGDSYESADGTVNTSLSEWRLIGPRLASLIVFLTYRMRLSRARVQEFLQEWFGFYVSIGTIDNCLREAALAALPVYLLLLSAMAREPMVHADETPWYEKKSIPWLWVFISSTIVLFVIGKRRHEVLLSVLPADFIGWLMSDGLGLYRLLPNRLRCLAHLIRKARGLAESLTEDARDFGETALAMLGAVLGYRLGEIPLETVREILAMFRQCCGLVINETDHQKTLELAKEFLNDWDAIWKVVEHPELPATNNVAERILRHWVIARQISHGTRTAEGSQAVAVLASIIETCRLRGIKIWDFLTQVITARRRGETPPTLPLPVAVG